MLYICEDISFATTCTIINYDIMEKVSGIDSKKNVSLRSGHRMLRMTQRSGTAFSLLLCHSVLVVIMSYSSRCYYVIAFSLLLWRSVLVVIMS